MATVQNIGASPPPVRSEEKRVDQVPSERPAEATRPSPQAPADSGQEPAQAPLSREQLEETTARLQEALAEARPEDWRVGIHEDDATGSLVIEIRDIDGEVIKQFPPEKILNLQRKMADLAGVVVDETI